ncbi:MAG: hypothetical protein HGA80_07115 [Candidatus Omnitrophica bacterium]|nr:hypothetical protein [Candidatus Omnitrophota bacterium]
MSIKLFKWLERELWVVIGLAAAGLAWFALMSWVVPFLYEEVSRFYCLDYSYLWDGVQGQVRRFAGAGFLAVAGCYAIFLLARLVKAVPRIFFDDKKPLRTSGPFRALAEREQVSPAAILIRELATAFVIVLLSAVALYFARSKYTEMRRAYFSETVSARPAFQYLSDREKLSAIEQYERLAPDAPVEGMLEEYGLCARALFYLQRLAFWCLIWGYPVVMILRTVLWARRTLAEEL